MIEDDSIHLVEEDKSKIKEKHKIENDEHKPQNPLKEILKAEGSKRCSYDFFGKKSIIQPNYSCPACNKQCLCPYCYDTCHSGCMKFTEKNDASQETSTFSCSCGANGHVIDQLKEEEECNYIYVDKVLGQVPNYRCTVHQHRLCLFCAMECNKECDTEIVEDGSPPICECRKNGHSIKGNAASSIQSYLWEVEGRRIWPLQVLNAFLSSRLSEINLANARQSLRHFIIVFANTMKKECDGDFPDVNCPYFSTIVKEKLSRQCLMQLYAQKKDFSMKVSLTSCILNVHLKTQFNLIKSYSTSDFFSMPLHERLLHRKFILTQTAASHEDNLNIFKQILNIFKDSTYSISKDWEHILQYFDFLSFYLKRMLLKHEHLRLLIETMQTFHRPFLDCLEEFKEKESYSAYVFGSKVAEIYCLIAVNWNDLVCYSNFIEKGSNEEENFIHNTNDSLIQAFVTMIIEVIYYIQKISFDDTDNEPEVVKINLFMYFLAGILQLICFPENFYFDQVKAFLDKHQTDFQKRVNIYRVNNNNHTQNTILPIKIEAEQRIHEYFTRISTDEYDKEVLHNLNRMYDTINLLLVQLNCVPSNDNPRCLKLYPQYRQLKVLASQEKENLINDFILSNFDDTATKIIYLFSQNIKNLHPVFQLDGYNTLNSMLSLLLIYFTSKSAFTYFLTGKNISRLIKANREIINADESKKIIQMFWDFFHLLFKTLKSYNIPLYGHKILQKFAEDLHENIDPVVNESWYKIQLTCLMKIFYAIADNYDYDHFEQIKQQFLQPFSNGELPFKISEIESLVNDPANIQCPCCQSNENNEKEEIVNIRMYFAFFKLISKNTYFIYKNWEYAYQFIFDQDVQCYEKILASPKLCLESRKSLLHFLKSFYFIERLNRRNYVTREKYMTTEQFLDCCSRFPDLNKAENIPQIKIDEKKEKEKKNDNQNNENENEESIRYDQSDYEERKKHANNMIVILDIYSEECKQFRKIIQNQKNPTKKMAYIKNLILCVRFISDFFYSEKSLMQLMICAFNNLADNFITESDFIVGEYLALTGDTVTKLEMTDIKRKLRPHTDMEWEYNFTSLMVETFSRIFKHLNWTKYSLASFLEIYDKKVEKNFSLYSLMEDKDYEYFYETRDTPKQKNTETKPLTQNHTQVQSHVQTPTQVHNQSEIFRKQLDIDENSLANLIFGSTSNIHEDRDRRKMLVNTFFMFCQNNHNKNKFEFCMQLMAKMLFYSGKETKNIFIALLKDDENVAGQVWTMVCQQLLENIVHSIALAKNVIMREKYLKVTYMTKIILQFLQLLSKTEFQNNLFQEIPEDSEFYDEYEEIINYRVPDTFMTTIKNTLLNCLSLLDFSPESSFDFPNDSLLVLLTNLIKFITAFQNEKNEIHAIINGQYTKFCSEYYKDCKKLDVHNNSKKLFYEANILLQLLISHLPITKSSENVAFFLKNAKEDENKILKDFVRKKVRNEFNAVKLYNIILENITNLKPAAGILQNDSVDIAIKKITAKYSDVEEFRENLQLKFLFKMLTLVKILSDDYSVFPLEAFKEEKLESLLFMKLLDFVTKVEIYKSEVKKNVALYFIRPPLTFHMSGETKEEFEESVDREKRENKLTALTTTKDMFMINMMTNFYHVGWKIPFFTMYRIHLMNFFIIIVENILLLGIYYRDQRMPQREYESDVDIAIIPEHDFWLGICHCVYLLFAIYFTFVHSNNSITRLFLREQVNLLKQSLLMDKSHEHGIIELIQEKIEDKPTHVSLSFQENFWCLCLAIFHNSDALIFFLNGALLIIFLSTGNPIWFVLPTLFVMYIHTDLFNIIIAIRKSWYKLLAVLLFTYMCIYIFMWFNMLYLTDFFSFGSLMHGETRDENYCHSTIPCLLLMIDKGIRSGGGIGDAMDPVSFQVHLQTYIIRFFYVLIFHIIIILILGNVFLSIIVDSYQDLRNKTETNEADKKSNCFLCQLTAGKSIASSIDFKYHRNVTHNPWNYVYFITYLNLKDQHEFSSNEAYAWTKIQNNDISWFPIFEDEKKD